jgi:hypothetical protein
MIEQWLIRSSLHRVNRPRTTPLSRQAAAAAATEPMMIRLMLSFPLARETPSFLVPDQTQPARLGAQLGRRSVRGWASGSGEGVAQCSRGRRMGRR